MSIPMTNADEDDWLYDVHVYPKNKSTYGGVTLQKKGQIGSKTPTKLEGVQFKLEVKSADGTTWTQVTKNNKGVDIGLSGILFTRENESNRCVCTWRLQICRGKSS